MAVVSGGETEGQLALDYEFAFDIQKDNGTVANEVVFSSDFTHNEDVWHMEVTKGDSEEPPNFSLNGKLRLISTTSKMKIARIDAYGPSGRSTTRRDESAMLFKSGDQFDLDEFNMEEDTSLQIHVEVLKYAEAMPNPKRIIQTVKSTLSTEVLEWFESEDFGDLTIVAADDKKLRCHRDVLSARSEVFRLMFSAGMAEARENLVNIDGYDGEIVSQLLVFIYTDEWEVGDVEVDLYAAAHHYELDRLKNLCESALMTVNLSEFKNVLGIQRFAELYHLDHLKAKCVDHLATHKSGKYRQSTAPKVAEVPVVRQARVVQPTGLTITSRIVDIRENTIKELFDDWCEESHVKKNIFPTEYKFAFTINNISQLHQVVFSNIFAMDGELWQLEVEKSGNDDVRCQLHLVDSECEELRMVCVVHIDDTQYYFRGKNKFESSQSNVRPGVKFDVPKVTPMALFQHVGDTHDFGTLSLGSDDADAKLEVQLVKWKSAENSAEPEPPKSLLINEVLKWIESEDFGDTTVVAKDGKKFRCHRDVLVRRSEVLKRMVNSGMQKANENVVANEEIVESSMSQMPTEVLNTEDFDGDIVAQLLLFIYTDECGNIGPIADRLVVAADHYQLDRLKLLCESALAASLSPHTFVKAYRLATDYHLDQLMAIWVDYVKTHKAVLPVEKIFIEAVKPREEPGAKRSRNE